MAGSTSARNLSIDALRGLIMVVMALDHASAFIARRHSSEFWAGAWTRYDSALPFLTRFVTHLCAPGFFFLMGAGLALFGYSRRESGWNESRIRRTLVTRGLVLLALSQFLEVPIFVAGILSGAPGPPTTPDQLPPGAGGMPPFLLWAVLMGLGSVLAIAGACFDLPSKGWWIVSIAAIGLTSGLTPVPDQASENFSWAARVLLIPGQTGRLFVLYPILPWLGITGLGVLFGRWFHSERDRCLRMAPRIGLAMVAGALALRAAGGFGNLRLPRDPGWIEFLNFIKYPPALVFTVFFIGANLVLLGLLHRVPDARRWKRTLAVFGQSPLFYYIAHLLLYVVAGALFFRHGIALQWMYFAWLASLIPLYWACRAYAGFKTARSVDSMWRFF
ncbi:MAG: DUF1624 domain-containing protein [Bryobacteraceae bacterium]